MEKSNLWSVAIVILIAVLVGSFIVLFSGRFNITGNIVAERDGLQLPQEEELQPLQEENLALVSKGFIITNILVGYDDYKGRAILDKGSCSLESPFNCSRWGTHPNLIQLTLKNQINRSLIVESITITGCKDVFRNSFLIKGSEEKTRTIPCKIPGRSDALQLMELNEEITIIYYEICDFDYYNCNDFNSCSEVMQVFNECPNDINILDGNSDGVPCDNLCG
ncbi:MAG: hypothetical protein IIA87_01390 [Nanoarchaeota archaeon]|nr:hypothetical protein [Nanoarchaeota archaeon]